MEERAGIIPGGELSGEVSVSSEQGCWITELHHTYS